MAATTLTIQINLSTADLLRVQTALSAQGYTPKQLALSAIANAVIGYESEQGIETAIQNFENGYTPVSLT